MFFVLEDDGGVDGRVRAGGLAVGGRLLVFADEVSLDDWTHF